MNTEDGVGSVDYLSISSSDLTNHLDDTLDKTYIGVDFGTSTTVVSLAYFDPNLKSIQTKPLRLNQRLPDSSIYCSEKIPTMIAWHNDQVLVGEGANQVRLKKTKNKNIWYSFKMDLGHKNEYMYEESQLSNGSLKIVNGKEAATVFFRYIHQQVSRYIRENGFPPNVEYSISIPASFEPNQRKDLLDALESNGYNFKEQALIDEPNAAFLSYISDKELQKNVYLTDKYSTNVLVFDYGAGTCDISILDVSLNSDKFTSSNAAISKFDRIGGKEIDRLIAIDVLLPQLLEQNELKKSFFTTREIRRYILPKLERYAELLKVEACESISIAHDTNDVYSLPTPITFKTRMGEYKIDCPTISHRQFEKIIELFTNQSETGTYRVNKNERFLSVFKPIKNALRKSNLSKEDIDYVLFIGGSSKNPLIRAAVSDFFDSSECLLPNDPQLHVSSGAAINSFLYNGYSETVVKPITNEPLFLVVKGTCKEELYTLISSGSELPSENYIIKGINASKGTERIELPICLGNKDTVLYNIIIENKGSGELELVVCIDSNRTIHCSVSHNGKQKVVSIENSLLSATDDKEALEKAEYEYSKSVSAANGKENSRDLTRLYKTYLDLGEDLKAAEVAEELHKKYNKVSLNNIGLAYSNGGDREKAISYYKEAMESSPSATVSFNLAMAYKGNESHLSLLYLEKAIVLEPTHGLAEFEMIKNKRFEAGYDYKASIQDIFFRWKSMYENGLFKYHYSWLVSCANLAGEYNFAKEISKEVAVSNHSTRKYEFDNLASINEEIENV